MVGEVAVVVIDLEHHPEAVNGQDRAVVLAVGVIIVGERVEAGHCSQHACSALGTERLDAGRNHNPATPAEPAELVV